MIDLRSFLGSSAKKDQLLEVKYTLGNVGQGRFGAVEPHRFTLKSEGELNFGPFFKGTVAVDLIVTNPGEKRCKVVVVANGALVEDDKATYNVRAAHWIEVYCTLKGVSLTLSIWRDGYYSNLKVWKAGIPLLHTWTFPLTEVLAAGEIPELVFSVDAGTAPEMRV
jgi:hypothetical protein